MDPFYRSPYAKHLHNIVVNGFWERDLDADDHEFLEYVRARGIANGSLPNTSVVLLEELEFWHLPYSIAPGVERRVGPRPREVETPEQRKLRKARTAAWHARREIRKHERAIAAVELAREQAEWKEANRNRRIRELISDLEWEAAAPPRKAKFGTTIDRHHVPQWKLDEIKTKLLAEKLAREQAMAAVRKAKAERKRKDDWQRARAQRAKNAEQSLAWREKKIAEARDTIEHARVVGNELDMLRRREFHERYDEQATIEMKQAILKMLNGSPVIKPHPNERPVEAHRWTVRAIARSVGCDDVEFVFKCIQQLVASGLLQEVGTVAA
jgi:hypothetical protein